MHFLMHCQEKSHKLVDPQVSLSFLFLNNGIAEYFVNSKLSYLVKQMYSQNLRRQHSISLINKTATKLGVQQIKRASQV